MEFSAVPREFWFVAAACRWPVAAAEEELRRVAVGALDWATVLRIARRHRVAGLLHNVMHAVALPVPDGVSRQLAQRAAEIARKNMAAARESVRLQHRFDAADVPVLMLKGVTLAHKLHGSIGLRHARDIDVLVRPEHAEQALHMLEADNYALVAPQRELSERQRRAFIARGWEMELVRKDNGQRVELHWRLAENPFLLHHLAAFDRAQSVQLSGGDLRTLDDASLFAYLCVHGAGHLWFRLKWLADIHALLAGKSEADLESYYRFAESVGAGLCAAQALLLCRDAFALPIPLRLEAELTGQRRVRWLVQLAWRNIVGTEPGAEPVHDVAYGLQELFGPFLLGRGLAYIGRQCAITLIAPADVIRWTMPSGLAFMYGVLRFPFWLWRRTLPSRGIK